MRIQGTLTAMVTPFNAAGEVDWDRLRRNAAFQIEQGINGLVPMGTTGESPTVDYDEHKRIIREVVAAAAGRVPVVAGTGSNSTDEAVELTAAAKADGADATLQVNPYYNKPTQEGLYRHFMKVAEVGLPVILYNIPGRCGVAMTPQTVARLARHPNVIGVKEATGSLDVASEIAQLCDPEQFTILSGDDSLTLPLMSIGGKGVISVLSNLLPDRVVALTTAALKGDWQEARRRHLDLFPLCKAMFIETNPIPVKTAMALLGRDTGVFRLPMCAMAEANQAALRAALVAGGVLK